MVSSADYIAARADTDLLARLAAVAEQQGVPSAATWVSQNIGPLITAEVEAGQTIADVYAYASNVRAEAIAALPEKPGINPGAVTDTHLASAVEQLLTPTE